MPKKKAFGPSRGCSFRLHARAEHENVCDRSAGIRQEKSLREAVLAGTTLEKDFSHFD